MVNYGNTHYDQDRANNPFAGPLNSPGTTSTTYSNAPFSYLKTFGLRDITDGTSQTLVFSEVIIGAPNPSSLASDHRGDLYNDDTNCFYFNVYTPPNSQIPDWMQGGWCQYPNQSNPPCLNTTVESFSAARSFHPGGVNAAFADGSVRFFKNAVALNTWRALGTIAGNETISGDSF
jgi:prepilin-type processing-associated H-X9-DG protein